MINQKETRMVREREGLWITNAKLFEMHKA